MSFSFFFLFRFQSETVSKINKILFSLEQNLGVLHPHNDRTELIIRTNFSVLVEEMRNLSFTSSNFLPSRYRLRGNEEMTCVIRDTDVVWSGTLPYCESK